MARIKIEVIIDTPGEDISVEDSTYLQDQVAGVIFDFKQVVDKSALYYVGINWEEL